MNQKNIARNILFVGIFGVLLVLGIMTVFSMRQGGAGTIRASFLQEKRQLAPVAPDPLTEETTLENGVSNEEAKEVLVENTVPSSLSETETDELEKGTPVEEKAIVASEPTLAPANKSTEKPAVVKTDERINCKMKAKEIKKDKKEKNKIEVSWECTNSEGWSCSIKRDKYERDNEKEQDAILPKGSTKMTIRKGYFGTGSSRNEYTAIPNEYKMECRSVDGKIERFEKVEWK